MKKTTQTLIGIKLSIEDKLNLQSIAKQAGQSLSAYVLNAIKEFRNTQNKTLDRKIEILKQISVLSQELKTIDLILDKEMPAFSEFFPII